MADSKTIKNPRSIFLKLLLASIMIVLVSISYVKEFISQQSKTQAVLKENLNEITCILFTPITEEPYYLIRLNTKSPWRLVRKDLPYPSDRQNLMTFIKSLSQLKAVDLKNHLKAGFDISSIPFITLYKGQKEEDSFYLGQRNTLKKEIYIQRASDQKVFLSPDIFSALTNQGFNYFVDLRLFPCVENQDLLMMKTICLDKDSQELPIKTTLIYKHTPKGWQSNQNSVPASASFSILAKLKAIQVLAQFPESLLQTPQYEIELLWSNKHEEKIIVYKGIDEHLLIRVAGKPYLYLLDRASLLQFYQ